MLNFFLNKNFFQSFKKYFFIFLILLNFLFIFNLNKNSISFAQNSSNKATTELIEKSEKNLQSVSDGKNGLIGCDAQDCGLDDLFALFKKIVLILITLIVISAFVLVIYYSILYYNKGDDANFLTEIKAKIKKVFWGLVLVLGSLAIVIGVLQAFGADKSIIMNVKKIFSQTDVSIFPKAFAAETSTSDTSYPTIVGGSIIKIIITALKVVLNYVVSPILIGYIFMTGILFVKAQGDSKELEEAKKKAKRLSIILLITLIAPVLLNVVLGTLTEVVKDVNDSVKVEDNKEEKSTEEDTSQEEENTPPTEEEFVLMPNTTLNDEIKGKFNKAFPDFFNWFVFYNLKGKIEYNNPVSIVGWDTTYDESDYKLIKQFQKDNKLKKQDGRIDKETYQKLLEFVLYPNTTFDSNITSKFNTTFPNFFEKLKLLANYASFGTTYGSEDAEYIIKFQKFNSLKSKDGRIDKEVYTAFFNANSIYPSKGWFYNKLKTELEKEDKNIKVISPNSSPFDLLKTLSEYSTYNKDYAILCGKISTTEAEAKTYCINLLKKFKLEDFTKGTNASISTSPYKLEGVPLLKNGNPIPENDRKKFYIFYFQK